MNGTLRSKQGCWTCRLRRKKCDEKHPFCSACEALTITCYGYGPKPDWMDNGEMEKAMANSIKQIVKKTSRQKIRLGFAMGRLQGRGAHKDEGVVEIAPKSMNGGTVRAPSSRPDVDAEAAPSPGGSGSPATANGTANGSSPTSTDESADKGSQAPLSWLSVIKNDEAVLLMHFIDSVFPLQYPMYRPTILEGGRGWLLSLLLRTKPLYHASLALSAYHRGTFLVTASRHPACRAWSTVEQEKHLAICLTGFQQAIKDVGHWVSRACPSNSLGLMACVIQLVFFELFAGHRETWQVHLRACTDVFCQGYWDQAKELGLVDTPDAIFDGKTTLVIQHGRSPPEEAAIFSFLSGVTIWLDVVSCITSGDSPRLLLFHPHAVACNSAIKLENIMGCKNWVILQLAKIAALHGYRTQGLKSGCFDITEFNDRAENIRQELQNVAAELSLASLEISSVSYALPTDPPLHPDIYLITRIFALAASTYLYLIVHGYQLETPEVRSTIGDAMMMLRTRMPVNLMNAIICPLYIMGSVAKREDEQFFRDAFSSAPILDPSLEHRARLLPLLEEIWCTRNTPMTEWTWEDTVRLSDNNILLI